VKKERPLLQRLQTADYRSTLRKRAPSKVGPADPYRPITERTRGPREAPRTTENT